MPVYINLYDFMAFIDLWTSIYNIYDSKLNIDINMKELKRCKLH